MKYTENLHLNLPSDADPLEVDKLSENFEKLDQAVKDAQPHKVGDTLTTWRTDLGENWLLCNGDAFDPDQYPELAAVSPAGAQLDKGRAYNTQIPVSGSSLNIFPATDGEKIGFMYGAKLLYSLDGGHTWAENTKHGNFPIPSTLFFANNHWIVFSKTGMYESASIDGTFTVHSMSLSVTITHLEYINGVYWVFGNNGDYSGAYAHFYDFDISGLVFTTVSLQTPGHVRKHCRFVRTNKFEFIFSNGDGTTNGVIIRSASDAPDGPYEEIVYTLDAGSSSVSTTGVTAQMHYTAGRLYGMYFLNDTSSGVFYIDENGDMHQIAVGKEWGRISARDLTAVAYSPGKNTFLILGYKLNSGNNGYLGSQYTDPVTAISDEGNVENYVYIYQNYSDPSVPDYISGGEDSFPLLFDGRTIFFAAYSHKSGTSSAAVKTVCALHIPNYALPIVDTDGYTYIKAKEGTSNGDQQTEAPAP